MSSTYCWDKKGGGALCDYSWQCLSNNCKWNGIANVCGCSGDGDCGSGDFCNGNGDCQIDYPIGTGCSRSAQCGAGTYCKWHQGSTNYDCNPHECCLIVCWTCYDTCTDYWDNYYCDY